MGGGVGSPSICRPRPLKSRPSSLAPTVRCWPPVPRPPTPHSPSFAAPPDQTNWETLPTDGPQSYWGGTNLPYRTWTASAIAFTSPREALLVLYNRQQAGGVVLRTDAGQTWTRVFERPQFLMHLHLSDAQRCWLSEFRGKLWRTADGGTTWLQDQKPEGDRTVSALAFAPAPSRCGIAPLRHRGTSCGRRWRDLGSTLRRSAGRHAECRMSGP